MGVTASFYLIQADATSRLLDRLRQQRGVSTPPSKYRLAGLLHSLGKNELDATQSGNIFQDVWNYLDVVCDLELSQTATGQPSANFADLGYPGVFIISYAFARKLAPQLACVTIDEREMRSLLNETYESDARFDIHAETEALQLIRAAIERIGTQQVGLFWFAPGE